MTVKELKRILGQYPDDAQVFWVNNWEQCDDEGHITDIEEFDETTHLGSQTVVYDMGLDWVDETQVLIG